jgi:amino acid transporter
MSIASRESNMLKHFVYENRHSSPHILLIYQAVIVTLLMLIFLLMPSVSSSYWLLTALAAQLYMLMYVLLFAAGIRLRFKEQHKHIKRPFRIPGKNYGILICGLAGIMGSLLTFCIGFIPPQNIIEGSASMLRYEMILIAGLIAMILPPFIIHRRAQQRAILQQTDINISE